MIYVGTERTHRVFRPRAADDYPRHFKNRELIGYFKIEVTRHSFIASSKVTHNTLERDRIALKIFLNSMLTVLLNQ